jgi:hypothetical protein
MRNIVVVSVLGILIVILAAVFGAEATLQGVARDCERRGYFKSGGTEYICIKPAKPTIWRT